MVDALQRFQRECFEPDLVLVHGGSGYGAYLKTVWPELPLLVYAEWWFKPQDLSGLAYADTPANRCALAAKNALMLQDLEAADQLITPTTFQKQRLPERWAAQCAVIHDGINPDFFYPRQHREPLELQPEQEGPPLQIRAGQPVISYATRGMEPVRGYPELLRALPALLERHPEAVVVIAGRDRSAYSNRAPRSDGSWQAMVLEELQGSPALERIHHLGLLTYGQYRELLWRTDLHVHFNKDYVPSWSLLEARACGANLCLNGDAAYATSVLPDGAWQAVNLAAPPPELGQQLAGALSSALVGPPSAAPLPEVYGLEHAMQQWLALIDGIVPR
jgi:glycosyltransferase involved in cell wall biosynthesis